MSVQHQNRIVVVTTLFLIFLFPALITHAQDDKHIVQAATILQELADGKTVDYNGYEIQGDVDFTTLAKDFKSDTNTFDIRPSIKFVDSHFDGKVLAHQNDLRFQFLQNIIFTNVTFSDDVKFSNANFKKLADFSLSTFTKTAGFNEVDFAASAGFRSVNFQGSTIFSDSVFEGLADFSGVLFCKSVTGDNKSGKECDGALGKYAGIDFQKTTFKNDALFIQLQANTPGTSTFANARFDGVANFAGCRVKANADFAFNSVQVLKDKADFSYCKWTDTPVRLDLDTFATLNLTGINLENSKMDLTDTTYSTLRTVSFDFDALINKRGENYDADHAVLSRLETNFKANTQQSLANEATFRRLQLENSQKKGLWQVLDLVFYQQFAGYLVDVSYPLKWICIIVVICGLVYGILVFVKGLKIVETSKENDVKSSNVLFRLLTISLPIQPETTHQTSNGADSNGVSSFWLLSILHKFKGKISWILIHVIRLVVSIWRGILFSIRVFSEVLFGQLTAQSDNQILRGAVKGLALLERVAGILLIAALTYIILYNLPALRILLGQ
jgi:hypothetical protein